MIQIPNVDLEKFDFYGSAYPPYMDPQNWCGSILPGRESEIYCSRKEGHLGPHRRCMLKCLYVWYTDPVKDEILQVCFKLGVAPADD